MTTRSFFCWEKGVNGRWSPVFYRDGAPALQAHDRHRRACITPAEGEFADLSLNEFAERVSAPQAEVQP